jgi:hypothetical protein
VKGIVGRRFDWGHHPSMRPAGEDRPQTAPKPSPIQ